jgi:hypothetical protein
VPAFGPLKARQSRQHCKSNAWSNSLPDAGLDSKAAPDSADLKINLFGKGLR